MTENPDGAAQCSACHSSLLPFSTEVKTGPDAYCETRIGRAEGVFGLICNSISSWIRGFKMRREIRETLRRKPASGDLTSIGTWIKVRKEEQKGSNERF